MIIIINGPFGVGKTSVASLLNDKIENSMIYDPEEIGFMLRNIITDDVKLDEEKTDNFQDLKLWKILTVVVAKQLSETYCKNLIVPMTIYNTEYYSYIHEGFEKIDDSVYHFCLLASKDTIHSRLLNRGDEASSWAFKQTEICLDSFEDNPDIFKEIIYTDELTVDTITEIILTHI